MFTVVDRLYVLQEIEGGKEGKQPGGMKVKKRKRCRQNFDQISDIHCMLLARLLYKDLSMHRKSDLK